MSCDMGLFVLLSLPCTAAWILQMD